MPRAVPQCVVALWAISGCSGNCQALLLVLLVLGQSLGEPGPKHHANVLCATPDRNWESCHNSRASQCLVAHSRTLEPTTATRLAMTMCSAKWSKRTAKQTRGAKKGNGSLPSLVGRGGFGRLPRLVGNSLKMTSCTLYCVETCTCSMATW
jgi:hypothetical protein